MRWVRTKRTEMWVAMAIFVLSSVLIVVVNSLARRGLHLEYSISRYVGLETWSAVWFALGNLAVAILMIYYFYRLGEEWSAPRGFYWVVVALAMALLGLSACPIGYFDLPGAAYASSTLSLIHEACSRIMFAMMLVLAMIFALQKLVPTRAKVWCGVFMVYGLVCVVGYLSHAGWFTNRLLIFESMYLVGFMMVCLRCGHETAKLTSKRMKGEK